MDVVKMVNSVSCGHDHPAIEGGKVVECAIDKKDEEVNPVKKTEKAKKDE